MRAVLVALVENKPGVLNRVVSLFRRRNFNMDSLTVGRTHRDEISRMTIVMDCQEEGDAQKIIMHLYKLIDVIEVQELTTVPNVTRDMALIKLKTPNAVSRNSLTDLTYKYGARIVDIGPEVTIVEVTGDEPRVEAAIDDFRQLGIVELVRTGAVVMGRGVRTMKQTDYESKRLIHPSGSSNGRTS